MPKDEAEDRARLISPHELAAYIADMTLAMMKLADARGLRGLASALASVSAEAAAVASATPLPRVH